MSVETDSKNGQDAEAIAAEGVRRPADTDFASLMEAMREGSEDAAFRIVERYSPHILRVIRSSLPRKIRAKVDSIDLLNTLLGSLLTNRGLLERVRDPQHFVALLTRAARNRVTDEHRRYTRYVSRDVGMEQQGFAEQEGCASAGRDTVAGDGRFGGREPTPSVIAASRERWQGLLSSLGRRDKRVLMLRIQGMSYDEIASQSGEVSPSTAKRIVDRAAEYLRA